MALLRETLERAFARVEFLENEIVSISLLYTEGVDYMLRTIDTILKKKLGYWQEILNDPSLTPEAMEEKRVLVQELRNLLFDNKKSFPYPSKFQKYGLAVSRSAEDSGVLRSCQLEALHAIRATRMQEQKEKLVVVMPTGVGKSPVILLAPYFLESRNVLVIAPDTTIRDQLFRSATETTVLPQLAPGGVRPDAEREPMTSFLLRTGIVLEEDQERCIPIVATVTEAKDMTPHLRLREFVIMNAQRFRSTTSKHPQWQQIFSPADHFDTVIVDEAHHFPAQTWKDIVDYFGKQGRARVIILTATPYRGDKKPVYEAGELIYELRRDVAVRRRTLTRTTGWIRRVRAIPYGDQVGAAQDDENFDRDINNLNAVKDVMYEHAIEKLRAVLDTKNSECPLPKPHRHQAMVMVHRNADVERFVKLANAEGLASVGRHSAMPNGQKERNLQSFTSGNSEVLVICAQLLEGFDHPPVSVVVPLKTIRTGPRFTQFVGRAVRAIPNERVETTADVLLHRALNFTSLYEAYVSSRFDNPPRTGAEAADYDLSEHTEVVPDQQELLELRLEELSRREAKVDGYDDSEMDFFRAVSHLLRDLEARDSEEACGRELHSATRSLVDASTLKSEVARLSGSDEKTVALSGSLIEKICSHLSIRLRVHCALGFSYTIGDPSHTMIELSRLPGRGFRAVELVPETDDPLLQTAEGIELADDELHQTPITKKNKKTSSKMMPESKYHTVTNVSDRMQELNDKRKHKEKHELADKVAEKSKTRATNEYEEKAQARDAKAAKAAQKEQEAAARKQQRAEAKQKAAEERKVQAQASNTARSSAKPAAKRPAESEASSKKPVPRKSQRPE